MRGPSGRLPFIRGMVFIPPLYSWYNIVGFWDPYGNTKGITVAIANNDDGTDNALIGKQNLGDQIVKHLLTRTMMLQYAVSLSAARRAKALKRSIGNSRLLTLKPPRSFISTIADGL